MSWSLSHALEARDAAPVVRQYSEHHGPLQWQFSGPSSAIAWALATSRDMRKASDLEMIFAYFAPPGRMLAADRRGRPPRPGADHQRRQVRQ